MQTQMRDYVITPPQSCKIIAAYNSFETYPQKRFIW